MLSMTRFAIVASILAIGQLGLSAVSVADQTTKQGQPQWRYTFHNGEWWYWLPTARWVYWRDNQWNDYNPQTYTSIRSSRFIPAGRTVVQADNVVIPNSGAVIPNSSAGSTGGSEAAANSDIRPFYGHSQSTLDRRTLDENGEVGPFYGHALPNEVFGRGNRSTRPYYGHAMSSEE